jgi:hypothetical protein
VGKTCSIHLLSNELEFDLLEINASDYRTRTKIEEPVGRATKQNVTIFGKKENSTAASFESFPFENLDYELTHYLGPGEIGIITEKGYEQLKKFPTEFHTSDKPLEYLEGMKSFVAEARESLPQDTALQNIIDEIADLINSTIFKIKFLE